MIEQFRHGLGRDRGDRRQRHQRSVGGLDVIVEQLLRIEPEALRHLRDYLVGASAHAEVVDIAAAEQRRKRPANVAHLEAKLCGLVAIDRHVGLRIIELQVAIEEDEHPALHCLLQELLGDVVQTRERIGGDDHELDRQAEAAGKRRRLERRDANTGNLAQFLLQNRLNCIGRLRSLVPRLEHHAGERLAGHIKLEDMLGFRMMREYLVHLARIELALLQSGVRRGDRLGNDNALVLCRRQLCLGAAEQKIDTGQHDRGEHQRDRQSVQAGMQPAFVPAAQPVELAVDEIRQPCLPAAVLGIGRLEQARTQHRR